MRFIQDRKRLFFLFLIVLAVPLITAFALDFPASNSQTPVPSPYPFPSPTYPPRPQPTPIFMPTSPPGMPPEIAEVTLGEPFHGQLGIAGYPTQHMFEGRAGQFIIATVSTSESVSFSFFLADINFYTLTEVNRFGNGIMAFLPYDGTFFLNINPSYNYTGPIDYTLTIFSADSEMLNYGDSMTLGLTTEHPAQILRFQGEEGDLVNLSAYSQDYNVTTLLVDPQNALVLADSRYSNRAPYPGTGRISLQALPATHDYYAVVYGDYLPREIDFTLELSLVEPISIATYGEPVTGQFGDGVDVAYYAFEGSYGDIVDVTVSTDDDLDTLLSIFGPNNTDYRITDDDGGADDNPEVLNFLINPEGRYLIEVQPFNTGRSGEYTLNLDLNPRSSLDSGPQRVDMGKNPQQYLSFSAVAGETIRLNVEVVSGFMPVLNITQQNALIANIGLGDLETFSTEFSVPDDGAVLVSLSPSRYYSPNTVIELSIERFESE